MKTCYCLIRRTSRASLATSEEDEARQLVEAKNNSHRQPSWISASLAYLIASDPAFIKRIWQDVMNQIQMHGASQPKSATCAA